MLSTLGKSHKEAILRAFEFSRLEYGFQKVSRDGSEVSIHTSSVWIAQVYDYWRHPITVARVAYWQSSDKQAAERGLVLIKDGYQEPLQFIGANPLRSIDVKMTEDRVHKALQALNLFEEEPIPRLESKKVPVVIEVSHIDGYRYLESEGLFESTDPTWRQLKHALVETIHEFTPLYGDKELSQFVTTQIAYR